MAQLADARRRVTRIVDFIACGKAEASQALAKTLAETEALVDDITVEVQALEHSRESVFRVPSLEWIQKRVSALREVLEQRTESSALLLRRLLGKIVLEPVHPASGHPYYVAKTSLDALVLLDPPDPDPGMDSGANVRGWWRQGQRQRWDPCPARAGINRWEVAGHAGHKHRSRRSGNEQLTAGQEPAAPGDEPIATCGQCRPPKLPPRTRG